MELRERIEKALDERVRPQLARHQGDVAVLGFEDGILNIRLLGQCSGCPSATLTTESLIAEEIQTAVPEVQQVILDTGVSESLLEEARALLRQRSA